MKKPELTLLSYADGRHYIELESLINWFEAEESEFKEVGQYAGQVLRTMFVKAMTDPNTVRTEREFLSGEIEH